MWRTEIYQLFYREDILYLSFFFLWGRGGGGGGGAVYVCTNPDLNGVVTLFNDVCV